MRMAPETIHRSGKIARTDKVASRINRNVRIKICRTLPLWLCATSQVREDSLIELKATSFRHHEQDSRQADQNGDEERRHCRGISVMAELKRLLIDVEDDQ